MHHEPRVRCGVLRFVEHGGPDADRRLARCVRQTVRRPENSQDIPRDMLKEPAGLGAGRQLFVGPAVRRIAEGKRSLEKLLDFASTRAHPRIGRGRRRSMARARAHKYCQDRDKVRLLHERETSRSATDPATRNIRPVPCRRTYRSPPTRVTLRARMLEALAMTARRGAFAVVLVAGIPSVAHAQQTFATPSAPTGNVRTLCAPDARYARLPEITYRAINVREQLRARLYRPDGVVNADVVRQLGHLLRDLSTGEPSPIVPRTLQLLVRISEHFHADTLEIVSGYRTGHNRRGHRVRREGYHGVGSAIDFRVPGQDMLSVAAYARTFAHAGVGWYPTSGFVHLDSREQSFHWENRSGAGHRGWDRPLDRSVGAARDAAWVAAMDTPWDPPGAAVELVLHPRTASGAHRPRHASRDRHGHHRTGGHHRLPPHVFHGNAADP